MQRDQFAWILNTSNGAEENSGVWTRGTDGYPTFANEDSLAIRKVVFDDDGTTSNRYTNYKGLVTFPENPEPAEGYVFSGWYNSDDIKVKPTTVFTADQTVNAVYVDASDVFWTINFYNAAPADTVLESKSYQHGSIVAYGGVAPTLAPTAKYTYTFKGWNVEPTNAVEDFDYHAVYDSTIRSYTVTFNNADGSKIESATFEYGKMPSCSKTPTRVATAEWTYSHKGWKPALDYVTEAATYTAIYDSSKVKYKVTFMNGTTVIDEQMVPYGNPAVAPINVTREGYKFVGWNTSFATVTEALTVKALFEELIIRTVNVVDVDGDKIVNTTIEDGEKFTLPEAPKKEGYTFDAYYDGDKKLGVAGDEISVTADITITAKYIENPKSSSSQQEIATSSSSSRNDKSSSSSSRINSSSSAKTEAIVATVVPKFSVMVNGRSLQISAARIGAAYALFDMQGKVLLQGRVRTANFEIPVMRAGSYLLKIESTTQRVSVR
ncbi:InlB B-repeat-containing protein [Fibrobacter sp. UWH4]|uniref:InlB B-repeat-containing protein n=1 Tax=Fibrobacter sp. UWH4 TaxID=1896210 RepID=UPI0009113860|nr:InlB B-repeat-containing protein [Fibrobacter sp. UWH4]SHK54444.1 repeat domain (List_Bact_rpt) [Fibrobacter sp. UWH4]